MRLLVAGPLVAALTVLVALICTGHAGMTFRDPDNVAAKYVLMVGAAIVLLVWLDIARGSGRRWPSRPAMRAVRRRRWTRGRCAAVAVGMLSFYVAYLAYRNLKATLPLLSDHLYDNGLADADRLLFAGHDPAALLHGLLGTGVSAHVLSTIYAGFIVFLPLSLAIALVFAEDVRASLVYAAALSINWILGIASYFLLPSLGPVYAYSEKFSSLPYTEATRLQDMLLDQRVAFLAHPNAAIPQAIAAFASLHIAMSFTALLTARRLGASRLLIRALWTWLILTTVATVYLGWHYFLDDAAGVLIGGAALALAQALSGVDLRELDGSPAAERAGARAPGLPASGYGTAA
jgi:PAP2 superfamily protein